MLANFDARRRSTHGIVVRRLGHLFDELCREVFVGVLSTLR